MTRAITLLAGLAVLTLSLVQNLPAQRITGSGRAMAAEDARNAGPIENPRKLPRGKLIGDTLYCIVVPGTPHYDEPEVDWEYGLWSYSVRNHRAELLLDYNTHKWLFRARLAQSTPDGLLILQFHQDPNNYFEEELNQFFVVDPSGNEPVKAVRFTAYDFEKYLFWGYLSLHGELITLQHPTFFKVLTLSALLNEQDSDCVIRMPLYGSSDPLKGRWEHYEPFPLKLADDGVSPFLVLDDLFGFRILDRDGHLLYQGGHVFSDVFSKRFRGLTRDGDALHNFIRASYPDSLDMVLYVAPIDIALTEENLVVFYDYYLECIFVCSPLGDLYKKIDRPDENSLKDIVGRGLTGDDGYMLVFDDGWHYFIADYSDIAEQVRSGKLDPLAPLRDLMGLEE